MVRRSHPEAGGAQVAGEPEGSRRRGDATEKPPGKSRKAPLDGEAVAVGPPRQEKGLAAVLPVLAKLTLQSAMG
eukprot:6387764-Lingulodinium_polyedra.AAC.1